MINLRVDVDFCQCLVDESECFVCAQSGEMDFVLDAVDNPPHHRFYVSEVCVVALELFHAVRFSSNNVASVVGLEHCVNAVEEVARGHKVAWPVFLVIAQ